MNAAVFTEAMEQRLQELARQFRLPTLGDELVRRLSAAGFADALPLVLDAIEGEHQARHQRRVERLRKASQLPRGKTFETLDERPFPRPLLAKLRELARGAFVEGAFNVLAFGGPGVGKSHALAAVGHALVEQGHSVLWAPTYEVVQELLAARRDMRLPRALRRYDVFDALILDDLGYIQQSPEEAEVLFTLMAERYERRSLLVSSNLVFSEWDRIFKNPMTTLAAVDRIVHHAVILEFNPMKSYRGTAAQQRAQRGHDAASDSAAPTMNKARTAKAARAAESSPAGDDYDNNDNNNGDEE